MNAKQIIIAVAALVVSLAAELLLPDARDEHAWWSQVPGFVSLFGFLVCLMLIVVAKGLGNWLQRPDDYYDREDRDE